MSDNPIVKVLLMAVIVAVCGSIIYAFVGFLYREDIISGRSMGSIAYWILLLLLVTVTVIAFKVIVAVFSFIIAIPLPIWILLGAIVLIGFGKRIITF